MIGNISVISSVLGLAGDWLEGRRRRQQARLDADIAIEARRAEADISWDNIQAQNAATSWQDDGWTLLFQMCVLACFIPGLQPYVLQGFEILSQLPDYFQIFLGLSVAAAYGYRQIVQPLIERLRR